MGLFKKKKIEAGELDLSNLPRHIGIIMDGNGRWAQRRSLPRTAGHAQGAENFRSIVYYCRDIGLQYLTVYAFSTENWNRPQNEVSVIMSIFKSPKVLGLPDDDPVIGKTGTIGIPEFGTNFTRQMLVDTQPDKFATLVRLSGFSHGTDVWNGNIHDLVVNKVADVNDCVGCRDDIMFTGTAAFAHMAW